MLDGIGFGGHQVLLLDYARVFREVGYGSVGRQSL